MSQIHHHTFSILHASRNCQDEQDALPFRLSSHINSCLRDLDSLHVAEDRQCFLIFLRHPAVESRTCISQTNPLQPELLPSCTPNFQQLLQENPKICTQRKLLIHKFHHISYLQSCNVEERFAPRANGDYPALLAPSLVLIMYTHETHG